MSRRNSTADIRALDAAHHIHPFTNTRELNDKGARVITEASGVWLTDGEGNRILDGMAGLWCTAVGYGRDSIVDAVAAQMRELPFYNTFFQSTHAPVAELSAELAAADAAAVQSVLLLLIGVGGDRYGDPAGLLLLAIARQARAQRDRVAAGGLPRIDRGGGFHRGF
jgi:4-aminobutyrate aminotransferase-like enzyme